MRKPLLIAAIGFIALISCRAKKQKAVAITKTNIDSTKPILPEIKSVLKNSFEYTYLSYKAKCDYKDQNNDQSFIMNLRMKRDSILWICIRSTHRL